MIRFTLSGLEWIPAFAGMTENRIIQSAGQNLDSRFRGNDYVSVVGTNAFMLDSRFRGNDRERKSRLFSVAKPPKCQSDTARPELFK